ncbi:hypothetical protein ACX27O_00045 [Micromonospora sp. SD19]
MVMDLTTIAQAVNPAGTQPPTITIALAVLGSSVVAGLIGVILGNTRANATARRERYAQAVRTLVAWAEYPYRIRRRTSDDAATLTALADRGHTLQEQLAESRGWIAAESRAMSEVFDACLGAINPLVGTACVIAWQGPPISKSAEMLLGDFGPRGINAIVARMECAIIYRFGLRRLMWRRWVLRRLRQRACLPETLPNTAE